MTPSPYEFHWYPFVLQLITWVLVFGGWVINIRSNRQQATRKETADKLTNIIERIEIIQELSLEFFSKQHDRETWQKKKLKLTQQLAIAALLIESLPLDCKEEILSAFTSFHDGIAMENYFDGRQKYPERTQQEQIFASITLYSRDLIITLQEAFRAKFAHA